MEEENARREVFVTSLVLESVSSKVGGTCQLPTLMTANVNQQSQG